VSGAEEGDEHESEAVAGADEDSEDESDAESTRSADSAVSTGTGDKSDPEQSNVIGDEEVEEGVVFEGDQGGGIDSTVGTKGDKQVSTKTTI
jgi:hypothetical protein